MTWDILKQHAIQEYYPALFLNRLISPESRSVIHKILSGIVGLSGFFTVINMLFPGVIQIPRTITMLIIAAFFMSAALWLISGVLQAFFNHYFYKSLPDDPKKKVPLISFELAQILYYSQSGDLIVGFIRSDEGIQILRRSGLSASDVKDYLLNRKTFISADLIKLSETDHITLTQYAEALFTSNAEFAQLLFAQSIQKKDFLTICDWIDEKVNAVKQSKRWWIRENLSRIPGIGKGFNYGQLYLLEKYEKELPRLSQSASAFGAHEVVGDKEIKMIESVLARDREANVFVVSNDIDGKYNMIARLNKMIQEGTVVPQLEHKRIVMLDTDLIASAAKTKSDYQELIMKLMQEAAEAGNVILVFPDFQAFLSNARSIDLDVIALLDGFFTSSDLHIIALTDVDRYHTVIERNPSLMERFDHVLMEEVTALNTLRLLQNTIIDVEQKFGIFFTYSALATVVSDADRYVTDGVMPDKAINLIQELAPLTISHNKKIVRKEDVEELVTLKTGVPLGEIGAEEREKLLNLEARLHQRIIGQNEAITAISQAVRRARSGINNPDRPLASFLFLGPTGVGKTETTKVLADVFFGNVAFIERLDMSEYAGLDAVPKLIGSYLDGTTGVLSTMIREHQYGVLLLDEFEKTTPEVMNIFLQILDEGVFSDSNGKKVNARNLLLIATSNAGAEMIWDAVKQGNDLSHSRNMIIDAVVKAHIFKPELLNRFDGVIIFHPLEKSQLEKVARLQLEKLQKRINERGINLIINDDLVHYVMKYGTDPKFGARPMARAVQDKVEQVIADKLIRGDIKPGSEVQLLAHDLV